MKLTVHILDGKSFVMNVGTGDNTVKWLSFAAGQRASSMMSSGRRRARDNSRHGGRFVVHHMSSSALERQVPEAVSAAVAAGKAAAAAADEDGILGWMSKGGKGGVDADEDDDAALTPNMHILQPDARIRDILKDGDEIFLQLQRIGELDVTGAVASTPWQDAAYGAGKSVALWRQALRERIVSTNEAESKAEVFAPQAAPQPTGAGTSAAPPATAKSDSASAAAQPQLSQSTIHKGGASASEPPPSALDAMVQPKQRPGSAGTDSSGAAGVGSQRSSVDDLSAFGDGGSEVGQGGTGGVVDRLRLHTLREHIALDHSVLSASLPPAMSSATNELLSVMTPAALQGEVHGASWVGAQAASSGAVPMVAGRAQDDVLKATLRSNSSVVADAVSAMHGGGGGSRSPAQDILLCARPLPAHQLRQVFEADMSRLRASRLCSSGTEGHQLSTVLWDAFQGIRQLFVHYSILYAEPLDGAPLLSGIAGTRPGGAEGHFRSSNRTTIRPMHDLGQNVPDELATSIRMTEDGVLVDSSTQHDPLFTQSAMGHARGVETGGALKNVSYPLLQQPQHARRSILGSAGRHTLTSTQPRVPFSPPSTSGPLSARGVYDSAKTYNISAASLGPASARIGHRSDLLSPGEYAAAAQGRLHGSSSSFAPSDVNRRGFATQQRDMAMSGTRRVLGSSASRAAGFHDPDDDHRMSYEAFLAFCHDTRIVNAITAPYMDVAALYCAVVKAASAGSALLAGLDAGGSCLALTAGQAADELANMVAHQKDSITAKRKAQVRNPGVAVHDGSDPLGSGTERRRVNMSMGGAQLLPPAKHPMAAYRRHAQEGKMIVGGAAPMSRSEMAQWLRVPLTRAMFVDALCELTVAVGLAQQRHRMAVALASRRKKLQKVQTVLRALQVTGMMQSAAAARRKAEGATGNALAVDTATGLADDGRSTSAPPDDEGLPPGFINPFSGADGSSPHHLQAPQHPPARRRSSAASAGGKSKLKNAAFKVQVIARKNSFRKERAVAPAGAATAEGAAHKKAPPPDKAPEKSQEEEEAAAAAKREESLTVDQLIRSEASSLNMDAREVRLLAGMGDDASPPQDEQQRELFNMLQLSPTAMSRASAGIWTGQPPKPTILQSVLSSVNTKGSACVPSYSGSRGPKLRMTGPLGGAGDSTPVPALDTASPTATPWQALKTVSHAVELTTGLLGQEGGRGGGALALGGEKSEKLELPDALFRAAGMTMRLFVPDKLDHLVTQYVLPRAQQVDPQAGIRRELARRKPIGVLIHERRLLSGIFSEYASVPALELAECAVQRCVRSHQLPLLSRSAAPPPPVTGVASDDQTSAWVQSRELAIKAAQTAEEEQGGDTIGPRRRLVAGVVVRDEDGALTVDTSLPEWRLESRMSYLAFRQLFVDCGLYDPSHPSAAGRRASGAHSTRTPLVGTAGDMCVLAERDIALAFLLATENTESSLGFSKLAQNAAVLNKEQLQHAEQLISEEGAAALLPGHHLAPSIMQSDLRRLRRAGAGEGGAGGAAAAAAVTWDVVASDAAPADKPDGQRRSRFRVSDGVWLRQFRERVVRSSASVTLGQFFEALARVALVAHRDTPNLDTHERIASLLDSIVAHKSWLVDRAHRVLLQYKETVASGRRSGRLRAANRRRNAAAAAGE